MNVPKQEVLSVLTRVGRGDVIEKAKRDLPDTIDTDSDINQQRLFESGLTRNELIDRMGGSP